MSYHAKLEMIIMNGSEEITNIVKELEASEWRKIENNSDNFPF